MAIVILVLVQTRSRGIDELNREFGRVSEQVSTYHETLGSVNMELGGLAKTSQRMLELGQDVQKLQDVLSAPTFRGGIGELMLEELLRKTLPQKSYATQYQFRNGNRVDAVIQLSNGYVPVDAKFPMESFRRLMECDETTRSRDLSRFRRDVRGHIDDIAQKYICPGETLDFALMYIPAENVYYEIILKADGKEDILSYAWDKRVIATSPNSFYAYLQVIALGLRGLQVEEDARHMLDSLTRLKGDFDRFADDYRVIGTHLRNAQSKHSEGLPKLESIQRALPGQLRTASAIEQPETEEVDDDPTSVPVDWEYNPPNPRRGRPHKSQ